ncbi:MAG TPA: SDR family NAD(P)-dependent oxidoreductase [Myxococcaceae bacterium]|jgi:uncharacterized oxidoreductase
MSTTLKAALVLALAFASTFTLNLAFGWLAPSDIQAWLEAAAERPALVFAGVVGVLAIDSVLAVPTMTTIIVGGHLLGTVLGSAAAMVGLLLAGSICYWGARLVGATRLVSPEAIARVQRTVGSVGPGPLLLARALPILPEVLSALAGAGRMPARRYYLWFALGNVPAAVLGSVAGSESTLDAPWPALVVGIGLPALTGLALLLTRKRGQASEFPAQLNQEKRMSNAKTVLITGGTQGVGRALVEKYAREGWRVATCARREEELRALEQHVPGVRGFVCDVGDARERRQLLAAVRRELGPVYGLINNAGIQHAYAVALAEADEERLEEEVRINLVAPLALGHLAMAEVASQGGFIANVSSGLAYVPKARSPVYCATKAALSMYTRSAELQHPGACFVEIVLPLVETRMTHGRGRGKLSPAAAAEQIFEGIASGAPVVHVGKARLLPLLLRLAPGLLTRLMNREDPPRLSSGVPASGVTP